MQPRCQPRSRQEQILLIPNLGRAQRDFPCIFEPLRVQRWPDRSRQGARRQRRADDSRRIRRGWCV